MDETLLGKISGLTSHEVVERRKIDGFNELPSQKKQAIFEIAFNVIREPMLLLLMSCGTLYFILGEPRDALMLLTFVFVVIGITFYQERKTERALEALKNLSSPRALVIRDGVRSRIAGREVVTGDILVLREGDRVPADAVVLSSTNLMIDESLLTGESVPVRKSIWDGKTKLTHPGGDDQPFVFSGTMVTQGHGLAKVTSVGVATEMGKIGRSLAEIVEEDTLLKKETGRIVRNFTIAGVILCGLIVVFYGLTRGSFLQGFLAGLTLAMAMLPEEFGVVLMIFLALGAWRMSRRSVLARKSAVLETLGAATVLCVDKTGTLTLNRMKLASLNIDDGFFDMEELAKKNGLPEKYHPLLEYAFLAGQRDPFDPLEKEIKEKATENLESTEHVHRDFKLVHEYPLSQKLLALSRVWRSPDKKQLVIAAKGAPEAIADLCHLSPAAHRVLEENIKKMSLEGLRVIAVARGLFGSDTLPKNQHDFNFELVGLLGFIDPVRSTVPAAVRECHRAGVRIIMITGDYAGTAQFVARKIGLSNADSVITGPELSKMNHLDLRERIKSINIFARVVPEQKLAIVNALKANGEIVAMTGDGVNDAPALKSAHIGIAMGERGTDVAREASDLVLLNDDFSNIVQAVRLGRRIFDNLKKAMAYIFAVHLPIAGMSLLPIIFKMPLVLYPAHIAFLELVIDPACSIVFESEKEEDNVMLRPPRSLKDPLFDRNTFFISLLQGLSVLAAVFIVYLLVLYQKMGADEARSMAFVTIVFANLLLIITNLSYRKSVIGILKNNNRSLWFVLVGTVAALMIILIVPFLSRLFSFASLSLNNIFIAAAAAVISLGWFEVFKFLRRQSAA